MNDAPARIESFRRSIEDRADTLLRSKGFVRTPHLEVTDATGATVVYLGTHLALSFSLEVRDEDVDLKVIRVEQGQLARAEDGGYSMSLFAHLVRHCGYRGHPYLGGHGSQDADRIDRAVDGLIGLLTHPTAAPVLNDQANALPR